jgi:CrcB protein
MNYLTIIAVASGGALGAVSRMLLNGLINRHIPHTLPFGTLGVNLIGSLLIGVMFALFHLNSTLSPYIKSFIVTGFLGALTTYSTFAIESFFLIESGAYLNAIINMTLNLFGTIIMVSIGYLTILQLAK